MGSSQWHGLQLHDRAKTAGASCTSRSRRRRGPEPSAFARLRPGIGSHANRLEVDITGAYPIYAMTGFNDISIINMFDYIYDLQCQ